MLPVTNTPKAFTPPPPHKVAPSDSVKIKTTPLNRMDIIEKAETTLKEGGTIFVGEKHSHLDAENLA